MDSKTEAKALRKEAKSTKNKIFQHLRVYVIAIIAVAVVLAGVNVKIYLMDIDAGVYLTLGLLAYGIIFACVHFSFRDKYVINIIDFATNYGSVQKELLKEHVVPYALLDATGKIMWMNRAFSETTGKEEGLRKSIATIYPVISRETLEKIQTEQTLMIEQDDKVFRILIKKLEFAGEDNPGAAVAEGFGGSLYTVSIFDETQLNLYIKRNKEQQLVTGLIFVDNYDEIMATVEDVKESMIVALIDRRVNKYMEMVDGLTKKIEKDKYFVVFKYKFLSHLEENKMSLLEDVRKISIGNSQEATLSIGIGVNSEGYSQSYEFARMAMDMALARGGDQCVVKDNGRTVYYGGSTKQVEKTTRVKARVKAHVLREIFTQKDRVAVMGHSLADVDSFGAAVGIFCMARVLNKKAVIIIDELSSSVRPFAETFMNDSTYPDDMLITSERASEFVDENTALVVVDVNRPSFTQCPAALKKTKTIVVLDHHRAGEEVISNAVLSYVEPYASSACEMVAEVLQYFDDGIKLKEKEADVIYAGMMIDTNNFVNKTGVRTFEAAAYLRRCGADVTRVRKMLRNDMKSYKARAEAVRHSEVFKGIALSVCPSEGIDSPTIVGAQAANELLNIIGVKASVVLTQYNDRIYVSARSIDEINVQLLMERLGGGGHANVAGAQIFNNTLEEAMETVKEVITEMLEEGKI